jgi:hypothetical protein
MIDILIETDPPKAIELPDGLTEQEIAETIFEVYGDVKWQKVIVFKNKDPMMME